MVDNDSKRGVIRQLKTTDREMPWAKGTMVKVN